MPAKNFVCRDADEMKENYPPVSLLQSLPEKRSIDMYYERRYLNRQQQQQFKNWLKSQLMFWHTQDQNNNNQRNINVQ